MTKDEIYERLAQVYLGKREQIEEKKKPTLDVKFILHIALTVVVLGSVFYGLTAFLSRKGADTKKNIIFALNNNPIRINYNLNYPFPQISRFTIPIPKIDTLRYEKLSFSVRGMEEGFPGVIKVVLKNRKNEASSYFIKGVNLKWQRFNIPLSDFNTITDWSTLTDLSFVFEAWNIDKKKGVVLIDDLCFSNKGE